RCRMSRTGLHSDPRAVTPLQVGETPRCNRATRIGAFSSSLPQDSGGFQWDCNAVAVRHHSRRIVARWTCSGYGSAIDAAAGCVGDRLHALHFHPYGIAAVDSVRVELNSRRIRVEIVQKDFTFKRVVARVGFDPQVSEAQRAPLPI